MGRTVCIDTNGQQIASYPYLMKLVQQDRDFYVGQELYRVVHVTKPEDLHAEDAEIIVELKKP